jgi:hypothetical protein
MELASEWDGDTIHYWYPIAENYAGMAILELDTTRIKTSTGTDLKNAGIHVKVLTPRIHPAEHALLQFSAPVTKVDTHSISILHDTLGAVPYQLQMELGSRRINFKADWKPLQRYKILFNPGAIEDVWGRVNDTLKVELAVTDPEQYGVMKISVQGLDSTLQYVLALKSGDKNAAAYTLKNQSMATLESQPLLPGKYAIEVIEDRNQNGVWDTGHYGEKRQPERKQLFSPDLLRAGWDLEVAITWQ